MSNPVLSSTSNRTLVIGSGATPAFGRSSLACQLLIRPMSFLIDWCLQSPQLAVISLLLSHSRFDAGWRNALELTDANLCRLGVARPWERLDYAAEIHFGLAWLAAPRQVIGKGEVQDRKSTRLNSSHLG